MAYIRNYGAPWDIQITEIPEVQYQDPLLQLKNEETISSVKLANNQEENEKIGIGAMNIQEVICIRKDSS